MVGAACGGADVRSCVYHVSVFVVHLSSLSKDTLCVPVAGRKFERSLLINLIPAELLHLQPFRRGRLASLPRHRRARRVLAMAWWARGGVAGCTAGVSVVHFSPNRPHHRTGATPRECSFGRSPPTRRPCAILVGPAPCLSRRAPPPTTRLSPRVRFVVFIPPRSSSVLPLLPWIKLGLLWPDQI